MKIDQSSITNMTESDVIIALVNSDKWLIKHTTPQSSAQQIHNALVNRFNELKGTNIPTNIVDEPDNL